MRALYFFTIWIFIFPIDGIIGNLIIIWKKILNPHPKSQSSYRKKVELKDMGPSIGQINTNINNIPVVRAPVKE